MDNLETMAESVKLKRNLGLVHGVAVICGLVIGSGIYIAPKGVLMRTGSIGTSIVLWVIGGGVATLGALSFAELGTTFPASGEKYHYLEQTFGPFVAFLYMWMYLNLFRPGANAVKCIVFSQYVLKPAYPDCEVPHTAVVLFSICLACVITAVNCRNVRWAASGQSIFTALGILALLIMSVIGLINIGKAKVNPFTDMFSTSTTDIGDLSLAAYSGIFAYWGWSALNFMVEELREPYKNLPRAIYISMALITILYVTINISYMGVLGVEGVLNSEAVAVTFAQKTMGVMAWIIPLLIAINNVGSLNSGLLVGSRLCFVGARRGHLPDVLSLIHLKFLTPITALLYQLALIILLTTVELYTLYNNLVFVNTIFDGLNVFGLLWTRYKKPDLPRPIKMPLVVPVVFLVCMIALAVFPLVLKPTETALGCVVVICTGVPYYVIFVLWDKPKSYTDWVEKQTIRVQKIFCSVKEEGELSH